MARVNEEVKASTCVVFTIVHNEDVMLPIWLRYYAKNVGAEHLWVLDHNTNDGSTAPEKLLQECIIASCMVRLHGCHIIS